MSRNDGCNYVIVLMNVLKNVSKLVAFAKYVEAYWLWKHFQE